MSLQLTDDSKNRLDALRKKEEEDLVVMLSQKYNISHANLMDEAVSTEAIRLIPEDKARKAEVVAFKLHNKTVHVGFRTPNKQETKDVLRDLSDRGYTTVPYMVSLASLEHAWTHYKDLSFAIETEAGVLDISSEEIRTLVQKLTSLEATRSAITEVLGMKKLYRITRSLEIVVAGALANKASDIHIEPEEDMVRIRFRIDGVLIEVASLDHETYRAMLTRIKLLSGLKINTHGSAQDGRFSIRIDTREIEIRTSLLPGNYGESVVMRLLDPTSIHTELESLGMRPSFLAMLELELQKPNGMILTTGPTGSGKTTTLYAFLSHIFTPEIKILTIEDPVEYHLAGIVQTQVNHKDYTFASGLRSALRQDPDVIMVGEIRDKEVAETAIHAALTGHLVFSTLHTNNAAGAFPRLIDMGVDATMVGSATNVVMAQRLLRTVSPEHTQDTPLEGADKAFVDRILSGIHDQSLIPENRTITKTVTDPVLGYKGRVGVYEAIRTTPAIETVVRQNLTIRELEEVARKDQGFLSMQEDAILKVLEGKTTLDEVRRILGE
jgi:type IV pilus assembly protein PilB